VAGILGEPPRLAWAGTDGVPDGPMGLRLDAPGLPDGARVEVTLRVETPRGRIDVEGATLVVRDGVARAEVPLRWPFGDEVVPGSYAYRARAVVRGRVAETAATAGYRVRPLRFFS
jgi:hypothetical protein